MKRQITKAAEEAINSGPGLCAIFPETKYNTVSPAPGFTFFKLMYSLHV